MVFNSDGIFEEHTGHEHRLFTVKIKSSALSEVSILWRIGT